MSHITLGQQGLDAAEARRWDEAITKLSKALQGSPNPAWLVARSKALISSGRFAEALADADLAWHKAYQRNRRPLMVDAHYRRAVAYLRLGQHANADCCCLYAMRLIKGFAAVEKEDPKKLWADENGLWTATLEDARAEAKTDPMNQGQNGGMDVALGGGAPANAKEWRMASTLRMQILGAMEKLPADHPGRKVTTSIRPEEKELSDLKSNEATKTEQTKSAASGSTSTASQPAAKPSIPVDAPLRVQEFQTNTAMNVSIFTKGVNKEKLQVDFLPLKVRLDSIIYPNGEEKAATFDLWAEIDPVASKHTVTPNKVELMLVKKSPGKWKQPFSEAKSEEGSSTEAEDKEKLDILKQARKKAMDASETPKDAAAPTETPASTSTDKGKAPAAATKPSYPTSAASGPKNWDSIVGADDDKSDDEDGKDVNFFFKKLFKNATPEQQRAMMKSFTESNGTSLSTDWDDVKGRTVETVPPEGVVPKKWD